MRCKKALYRYHVVKKTKTTTFFVKSLDYKMVQAKHKLGDMITIKSIIENPSDISFNKYPKNQKRAKPEQ
jgi:hypothetical protein